MSRPDFEYFFGQGAEMTPIRDLSQPGQFLAGERLSVQGPRGSFERVAILGPFRSETQIEVSMTDTRHLGLPGVIRQSGDLEGTSGCVLRHEDGRTLELSRGLMVAKRHIHMTPVDALQMNVKDNENVFVIMESYERSLIYADVVIRVHPNYRLAMHVDTDEANAFVNDHSFGTILKLFDGSTYSLKQWAKELQSGIARY
jgi:propanediol utilization protein